MWSSAYESNGMKPLRRIILNALIVLSPALCAATVILWAWSEFAAQFELFGVQSPDTSYGMGTERGAIIGYLQRERTSYRSGDDKDVQLVRAGFRYLRITSDGMRRWNLVLPFWFLAGIWSLLPLTRFFQRMRSRRQQRLGRCLICGYDLRSTPNRCPECGTVPMHDSSLQRPDQCWFDPGESS
jgi:hypothetical protein